MPHVAGDRARLTSTALGWRLLAALVVAVACASTTGCVYARIAYYNAPTLDFNDDFVRREVAPSPRAHPLEKGDTPSHFDDALEKVLVASRTRAFVVVRDDRIIYERYFRGTTKRTPLPSFSLSKTFAALLVGCAVDDHLIASTADKLVSFVPELAKRERFGDITIDHLLRMTSGIDFEEESADSPILYYATDLRQRVFDYDVKWAPGTHYVYGSLGTQLLWEVLQRKLGGRTVASYFQDRLWQPLGAEAPATWSIDSVEDGAEKLFGGFAATARDHARLGLLFLHGGQADGHEIVTREWVKESTTLDPIAGIVHTMDGAVRRARYQWFLTLDERAFFAKGYDGQYVFVVPSKHMVFVRFGDGYGGVDWTKLFFRLADEL